VLAIELLPLGFELVGLCDEFLGFLDEPQQFGLLTGLAYGSASLAARRM